MNYYKIRKYDISNGAGIRTTIFFSGCKFHCPNCFNSELWDFNSGKPFDETAKKELYDLLADEHCCGLSILGGEPLQQNLEELLAFVKETKELFPSKDIWLWSGYYLCDLNALQREIVNHCDYFIDGPFKEAQSGLKLRFRGSSNQTIWKNNGDGEFVESKYNEIVK